jgi:hypothetical protein
VASQGNSVATIIGVLFASGALGYLFATIHHWGHWHLPSDENIINHTECIKSLREKGLIPPPPAKSEQNPRLEAFITLSVLWFERLNTEKSLIGNAAERVAIFGDLAHSAGTARIASVFALLVSFFVWGHHVFARSITAIPDWCLIGRFIVMLALGVVIVWLFHDTYKRTGQMSQRIHDQILLDALEKEKDAAVGRSGRAKRNPTQ